MAPAGQEPVTEPVRQPAQRHLPVLLAMAAAMFVVLAVLKPWSSSDPAPTVAPRTTQLPGSPRVSTGFSPPSSTDPTLQATLFRRQCQSGAGWRIVSIQRNAAVQSRTLWAVDPNPAMTVAAAERAGHRLWAEEVSGLGFCTPGATVAERVSRIPLVTLWVPAAGAGLTQVVASPVIDPALAAVGEVYLKPPRTFAPDGRWPAGNYLFRVASDSGEPRPAWCALEVTLIRP